MEISLRLSMLSRLQALFVLTALGAQLSGCAQNPTDPSAAGEDAVSSRAATTPPEGGWLADKPNDQHAEIGHLNPKQRSEVYNAILVADLAAAQGDNETALVNYLYAASITLEPKLAQKAAHAAEKQKDYQASHQAAEIWLQADPKSLQARQLLAVAALRFGDIDAAVAILSQIVDGLPNEEARYQELAKIVRSQQDGTSLQAIQQLHQRYPDLPSVGLVQYEIWQALAPNQSKELGQHLEQLLTQHPDFMPAVRFKTQWLLEQNRRDEALSYLQLQLQQHPDSRELQMMVGRIHYQQRAYQQAAETFKQLHSEHRQDEEIHYLYAASLYASQQFEQALPMFNALLETGFESESAAYYCGDAAERIGKLEKAKSCYRQVPQGRLFLQSRTRLASVLAQQGRITDAKDSLVKAAEQSDSQTETQLKITAARLLLDYNREEEAKKLIEQELKQAPSASWILLQADASHANAPKAFSEQIKHSAVQLPSDDDKQQLFMGAAQILSDREQHLEAYAILDHALAQFPNEADLLYMRALLAEPLKRWNQAEQDLRAVLAQDPDNPNAQNALGYTLADTNQKLDEAEDLIKAAYQQLPDSAAVIDSMGWLAYRKGDLKTAIQYLTEAFELEPSPEIAAHLGEVLWQLDRQEDARKVWLNGLQQDPDNRYIRAALEKFSVKFDSRPQTD